MTDKEVLEKAITKAIDSGWYPYNDTDHIPTPEHILDWFEVNDNYGHADFYKLFIFSHDFAKALWGDDKIGVFNTPTNGTYRWDDPRKLWKYHLQNMVISEDPIQYLKENI